VLSTSEGASQGLKGAKSDVLISVQAGGVPPSVCCGDLDFLLFFSSFLSLKLAPSPSPRSPRLLPVIILSSPHLTAPPSSPYLPLPLVLSSSSFQVELGRSLSSRASAPPHPHSVQYFVVSVRNTPVCFCFIEPLRSLTSESSTPALYLLFSLIFHDCHDYYDHNGCTSWRDHRYSNHQ
jgi:hypothetical protein